MIIRKAGRPPLKHPIPPQASGHGRTVVLLAVIDYHRRHGYGPAVREICATVGLNISTVWGHLTRLRRDGLVAWEDGRDGTLRPTCEVVAVST